MLTPDDSEALAGMVAARLFSAMIQTAMDARPVESLDAYDALSRDLLDDLQAFLLEEGNLPQTDQNQVLANRYCDKAIGDYVQEPVALVIASLLQEVSQAFNGNQQRAVQALRSWLSAHGRRKHTQAWLVEQAAGILVADVVDDHAVQDRQEAS